MYCKQIRQTREFFLKDFFSISFSFSWFNGITYDSIWSPPSHNFKKQVIIDLISTKGEIEKWERKYLTNTEKGIKVFNMNCDTHAKSFYLKINNFNKMDECKVPIKVIFFSPET